MLQPYRDVWIACCVTWTVHTNFLTFGDLVKYCKVCSSIMLLVTLQKATGHPNSRAAEGVITVAARCMVKLLSDVLALSAQSGTFSRCCDLPQGWQWGDLCVKGDIR